jgi:type II secretory pathway component PulK
MRRRDGGFAMLLVIVVSVALIAIAIPFAISMRAQERGAKGGADRAQARYNAFAGRSHALSGVVRGHEASEEGTRARAPFDTPMVDGFEEYAVSWSQLRAGEQAEGAMKLRGAQLQDEQAKVNVRTAPQAVIDRVKSRIDPRVADERDYLTEYSGRTAAWVAPQTVRGIIPGGNLTLVIDSNQSYAEGARIRLTGNGAPAYGTVVTVDPRNPQIEVQGIPESASDVGAVVEIECRHPVNINTASELVIAACLEGLALRNKITEDQVLPSEASALAAAIVKRGRFDTIEDFQKFLGEQRGLTVISNNDELAIYINFLNPTAHRLAGTGTVPFSLNSWSFVTVVSHGMQDLPSGAVAASVDMRDVVEMAPSGVLRWRCRSQYDLEKIVKLPTANMVQTWPMCVAAREVPSQDRGTDAWVKTVTGRDGRGNWPIQNHFDPWLMGQKAAGTPIPTRAPNIFQIPGGQVDIDAGACEMWVRTNAGAFTVFDVGPEQWSNRLHLSYGYDTIQSATVLKLQLKDATLDHAYAQITHAATLTSDTWYHLGGYWKGTKMGHSMVLLDGMPVGRYGVWTETGQSWHTTLAAPLLAGDTTISTATTTAGFPVPGAIEIGTEVIEYTSISGNGFGGLRRQARGTVIPANDHAIGAGVTVYGYGNKLAAATITFPNLTSIPALVFSHLETGGGALTHDIGVDTFSECGGPPPAGIPPVAFPAGATSLTITSGDGVNYPTRGWLSVGLEVIHYDNRTSDTFTGITRGLFTTTDSNHLQGEPVALFGFHVTDNSNYLGDATNPTVISLDDGVACEWVGPVVKEGTDGWRGVVATLGAITFPVRIRANPNPPPPQPDFWRTPAIAHVAGSAVLPTFALERMYGGAGDGDSITLVEQNMATREAHVIRRARRTDLDLDTNIVTASPDFTLASLSANVLKDWIPDNLYVRALKFPSGELMAVQTNQLSVAGSAMPDSPGGITGHIDELRLITGPKNLQFLISADVTAADTTIPIANVGGMDTEGGAILVGDELIGYASIDTASNELLNCTRGYLGTTPAAHGIGERLFNLSFLAIASLTAAVPVGGRDIPCSPNGFQQEGYCLIGSELIGYTAWGNLGVSMPPNCNFRGAFGTREAAHNPNDLVYDFPFRYFDRFTANSDDSKNAFFTATFRATGAVWRRVIWEERLPNSSMDLQVRVRFNGMPRWTSVPTNKPYLNGNNGVWLLTNPAGNLLTDALGDQIEIRVDFVWLDDAYLKGEWKECPELHAVLVDYEQEPVTHHHEEK